MGSHCWVIVVEVVCYVAVGMVVFCCHGYL